MRYFWALLAYVSAIVVTAASCGGGGKGNSGFSTANGGQTSSGAANGGSGASGGGGSSTTGITFTDGGTGSGGDSGGHCMAYLGDCAAQKLNCGMASDGCGDVLDCGMCTVMGETCGGTGTANVCGKSPCIPQTCASQGFDCGMAGDGCGKLIDCGACMGTMTCGASMANKCGNGICVPTTCAALGYDCGMWGDGCMGSLNCGLCIGGKTCGANAMPGKCGAVVCTPTITCASKGWNCGMAVDDCQNILNCGSTTCSVPGQTCGGGGVANVCGSGVGSCTNLCLKQTMCPANGTTSISSTVYAPNGTDPLPNVLVYVPNSAVTAFVDGVQTPAVCCAPASGNPLVSATTDYKGQFTITNMPVGTNIPLVIQTGKWRRQFVIPNVASCVNTALPTTGAQQLRMPKTKAEGDIPKIGFVTGSVDALECVLRKIGIADTEFSDPTGTGRVQMYTGDSANPTFTCALVGAIGAGAHYSGATPDESQLINTQAAINKYDMVFFACKGCEFDRTPAWQQIIQNYANNGGRIFTTHYGYVWLFNDAPFSSTATWNVDQSPNFSSDPETGYIVQSFPKGQTLAQWLQFIGASSTLGQMPVATLRDDFMAVNASNAQLWIYLQDPNYPGMKPMHYTFDTPVAPMPSANACGKVLYDDFHVEDAVTNGLKFPNECTSPTMTPQEKMLEYMIFDLGSCPKPPTCSPATCGSANTQCGPVGDGCGNIIMCGACPSGQSCVGGMCKSLCTPQTCASQGFNCGMQGDGCGNLLNCGSCPSGTCGGGGMGKCGSTVCVGKTCAMQGIQCGSTGDGCGNPINCGLCPTGKVCGTNCVGGNTTQTPGMCGAPCCTPKTCAQQGFNCGNQTDGCGATINCGTCPGTQTCGYQTPGQCGGGA